MSRVITVDCTPADATAYQCHDCEREEAGSSSFYDGPAEMAAHEAAHPEHRRITWLRREVV